LPVGGLTCWLDGQLTEKKPGIYFGAFAHLTNRHTKWILPKKDISEVAGKPDNRQTFPFETTFCDG
jgi:hypothetical protein